MVSHLSQQFEGPHLFSRRVLVCDSRQSGFQRAYNTAGQASYQASASLLKQQGLIDDVVYSSDDSERVKELNTRWLGKPLTDTHSASGTPLTATFEGLEVAGSNGGYCLMVDVDMLSVTDPPGQAARCSPVAALWQLGGRQTTPDGERRAGRMEPAARPRSHAQRPRFSAVGLQRLLCAPPGQLTQGKPPEIPIRDGLRRARPSAVPYDPACPAQRVSEPTREGLQPPSESGRRVCRCLAPPRASGFLRVWP
eukprot:scaffold275122_cov31-Prasinocladus_malaysianus.AAC.1